MNPDCLKRYAKCSDKIKEISLEEARKLLSYMLLIIFSISIFFNLGSLITRWTFYIVPNIIIFLSVAISSYMFFCIRKASTKHELKNISSFLGGINVMISMLSIFIFSTNFLYLWTVEGNLCLIIGFLMVNIVFITAGYFIKYSEGFERIFIVISSFVGMVLLVLVMLCAKYVDLKSFNSFKYYISNYIRMNLHYFFIMALCSFFTLKNGIWLGRYLKGKHIYSK